MRGLKSIDEHVFDIVVKSHSTRVRGLKYLRYDRKVWFVNVALYTSAWIEIPDGKMYKSLFKSHSTRVRGLKFCKAMLLIFTCFVALYTSAWIEMFERTGTCRIHIVALYTSAWIEMSTIKASVWMARRRTLHECVD